MEDLRLVFSITRIQLQFIRTFRLREIRTLSVLIRISTGPCCHRELCINARDIIIYCVIGKQVRISLTNIIALSDIC